MRLRIPRKIDFGLAEVKILFVSKAEMHDLADCDLDEDAPDGLWDASRDTIYLRKRMNPALRRDTFWHELQHCILDNNYWSRHGG